MQNAPSPTPTTPPAPSPARRAVLTTAAWATPVAALSVAAPAIAASLNCRATQNYGTGSTYVRGTATTSSTAATGSIPRAGSVTGGTVAVTFAAATYGGSTMVRNLTVEDGFINIWHSSTGPTRGQRVTVSFSEPVTGLTFDLQGFTRPATGYNDTASITVNPPTTTFAAAGLGAAVTGTGTPASPWTTITQNAGAERPASGNVSGVAFSGPVTSFTIEYTSPALSGATQQQRIFLGPMTVDAACA